jgi:hypothetical protein
LARVRKRVWKNKEGETSVGWTVDALDVQDKRQRKQFESRREADAVRVEIEGQLRVGTFRRDADKVTVKDFSELFIAHCEARMQRRERMTRRNYQTYLGYVRNYICPDPEWHAKKHSTPSHAFRYFDKGIGDKTLAQLSVGSSPNFGTSHLPRSRATKIAT